MCGHVTRLELLSTQFNRHTYETKNNAHTDIKSSHYDCIVRATVFFEYIGSTS